MVCRRILGEIAKAVPLATLLSYGATSALAEPLEVAKVDDQVISKDEVERAAMATGPFGKGLLANPVARQEVLDRLIEAKLLAKAAAATSLPKDPEFTARLEEARTRLLAELFLERQLASGSTDAAARAFFARDPARFGSREILVTQLVTADAGTAELALAEARKPGADFAAVIKRYADPKTPTPSGKLGWFGRGRMLEQFEDAAFATPKGSVHGQVVKTSFGFHVIKVEDERGSDVVQFESVQERVVEALRAELHARLLADLKKSTKIAVNAEALRRLGKAAP